MTVYFVDDGGTPTAPYDTWAKAAASIQALDTAVAFASGDIVYIGADANCTDAAAALTIVGPTSGLPTYLISSTVGAGADVSYSAGTGHQILATGASSTILFDGAFALYGIRVKAGSDITLGADTNEQSICSNCKLLPGANKTVAFASGNDARCDIRNLTIDCSQDSGASTTAIITATSYGSCEINGLVLANVTNRTGLVFNAAGPTLFVSGADFSGLTNGTLCELIRDTGCKAGSYFTNCKTDATWGAFVGALGNEAARMTLCNVGPTDNPAMMQYRDMRGDCLSTTSIYRTGGATVEADAVGWLITTTANCAEGAPFYTPWIYGVVDSTGSKAFDCYITNDTADFTDAQVWLEVEYLATADDAKWTLATDQRATITTTAAAQTDDVTSTWNGTGPAFTYKQNLSVAATVNETGQYRARVAVGVASIASSRYFYVDPKITVS